MTTPEERLLRSLPALRELVDAFASQSPSEAGELLRLDRLVRRYPAAARTSLRLLAHSQVGVPVPQGWSRAGEVGGVPLWRWGDEPVFMATGDMDQLWFAGVALRRFDAMSAEELRAYLRE